MIIPSEEIAYRNDFALLCNARGIRWAVEVGTDRGVFAHDFMTRWNGEGLLCVDPYTPYDEYNFSREADRLMAVAALQPFHGRVKFVAVPSPAAVDHLPAWLPSPGFVYIDGCHTYEAASADIAAWWPRVWGGGMLAGHDYDESHPGVMLAVQEFADRERVVVRLTKEREASWYAYKAEPPTLMRRYFVNDEIPNPHAPCESSPP